MNILADLFYKRKSVGLVLSGGGARGFFHMGVIKALQELNIKIDYISGTSIGAVVGAIYAANPQVDFEKISREIDFFKVSKTFLLATTNNNKNSIENFFKIYLKADNFLDLKIPLVFNATDINRKKEIVFNKGKLFPALVASVSIPGVFPPVEIDDHFLVDGGVINNVPISLLPPVSKIIVSDITGPIKKINEKTSQANVLYSSVALMQQIISLQKINFFKRNKIVYLHMNENKTFILDFRKKNYQKLIDLGYETLMAQKDSL